MEKQLPEVFTFLGLLVTGWFTFKGNQFTYKNKRDDTLSEFIKEQNELIKELRQQVTELQNENINLRKTVGELTTEVSALRAQLIERGK